MPPLAYTKRRGQIETYFDKTAVANWSALTSDAPVSGIRATVRRGREQMRRKILGWLPTELSGTRILDAGCGTGTLACELADRGAEVVGVDLSANLIALAQQRSSIGANERKITFVCGDLLDPAHGAFDYVVSMDSLIHYDPEVAVTILGEIASRTRTKLIASFVPHSMSLALMYAVGRCLPNASDRAPSISLVRSQRLRELVAKTPALKDWSIGRCEQVRSGFYISEAWEIVRP